MVEIKQNKFAENLDELRAYPARGSKYIVLNESVFKDTEKFYDSWKKIVNGFKNKILSLSKERTDILDTLKQKRFNDFLSQIREDQKNIDKFI